MFEIFLIDDADATKFFFRNRMNLLHIKIQGNFILFYYCVALQFYLFEKLGLLSSLSFVVAIFGIFIVQFSLQSSRPIIVWSWPRSTIACWVIRV